jgi:hypothetical protein
MRKLIPLATVLVLAAALAGPAAANDADAFDRITDRYEAVRLALLADSTEGVKENAIEIHRTAEKLADDFDAEAAGVDPAKAEQVQELLPEIVQAAADLAEAGDLQTARDAFYALSKPLVRYRAAVADGDLPAVVYCAMARRSWLQPEENEIGNPYHGQSMAKCGEVVEN